MKNRTDFGEKSFPWTREIHKQCKRILPQTKHKFGFFKDT